MKNIALAAILVTFLISCSSLNTDKTKEADYNRGYNKNCGYQYGTGNSNCSAETF